MRFRNPRQLIRPFQIVAAVHDISLQSLADGGIRGIVVDLDNTLVGWRLTEPTAEVASWVREAIDRGFAVAIVSNNVRAWVKSVATRLGIVTFVHRALKPLPFGVIRAVKQLGIRHSETVVVGDQLFADVLAAKLLGIRAILTDPIVASEHRAMGPIRALERFMLRGAVKKEK